jgi:5-(carboxyamino)imidazole ribonucleotide synthase
MVARNENNDIKTFPISENIHENNILDMSLIPARISNEISIKIEKLAYDVLNKLQGSGVFGIELFLTKSNEILINEIAPRVHNSGHYTIEGCETNQFQQHIRSIFNLPLGSTLLHKPAVMINLLGSNSNDTSFYRFIKELLEIPRLSIHLYGKQEEKFKRKMGHIVIVDEDLDVALQKALEIKKRYLL